MPNITFVQNLPFFHYGMMSIAACLQKCRVSQALVIIDLEKRPIEAILATSPDVVGFYCYSGLFNKILQVCKNIKAQRKEILTIVGGPHPTTNPDIVQEEGIDMVCVGEGEGAMEELCVRLSEGRNIGNISNLWMKDSSGIHKSNIRPLIEDLDSLPFYNYGLYEKYPEIFKSGEFSILGSRGCPYRCTYCHNHFFANMYRKKGRWYRTVSPKRLVDEIEANIYKYKMKRVAFADDTWGADKQWLACFAKEYKERINLPFFVAIRPNLVNEEVVGLMAKSGCYCLSMGIESGSYRIRKEIMDRDITDEQILTAAKIIKKYGIELRTSNIMGLPGETYDEALETLRVNIRAGSDYPWFYMAQPYPKTDLSNYAIEGGFLETDFNGADSFDLLSLFDTPIKQVDKRVRRLHRYAVLSVLYPWLLPLVEIIVHFPIPDFLNKLIAKLAFAMVYKKVHKISLQELINRTLVYSKNLGLSK